MPTKLKKIKNHNFIIFLKFVAKVNTFNDKISLKQYLIHKL